jgi:transcription elongation factor GreB
LREIDRRIRYLQQRLPVLKVITKAPDNQQQVFFAAWVTLEDESGESREYRIVGPDEIDQHPDYISLDSPMARALLKKALDDQIEVKTPSGSASYWIIEIRYDEESD